VLAIRVLVAFCLALSPSVDAALRSEEAPDQVRMNDGTELRGLILQNTSEMVVLETRSGEARIPKEYIRRIDDAPNGEAVFADLVDKDDLPSWRSIVHDMRTYDGITSFEQIPPTAIDNGLLRNIPYLSFKVNGRAELNVYGDPDKPVAVEYGVYGAMRTTESERRMFREYIAGHMGSKEQIAALYSLSPEKRDAGAGRLNFRLILPNDADGYGGTWMVVYRPDRIEGARLSGGQYAVLTRPFKNVNNPDGSLRSDRAKENQNWLEGLMESLNGEEPELRGFYRDADGTFHVLTGES
jgi:hypothetical protein